MPHLTGSDENSHLNGLFFPARLAICCKIRGFKRQLASSLAADNRETFWRDFGEEKKLIIFNTLKAPHPLNKKVELE
ncbi:hypothetical protein G9X21_07955 [Salmonella enterica subsp. enterica serovar Adjame]|nr:hypothetical protein G9X21_07955 [Salmonella enterica subsp. enterica serovar Adjame]